ncbi:FMN-dependent NADH-azoreductase [Cognatishimia sp.]|uniref:FMN-dependent NADH-azoreductase n=1 Tax=Cognatishimia sp. TaxID=2211648 RepID=UPI0035120EBA
MSHTVLQSDASARHQDSVSRRLSSEIVAKLGADTVIRRDLAEPLPLLDEGWVTSTFIPPQDRTDTQADALSVSDTLVAELQKADTVVIGTPIYNFSGPAVLKAWVDQVARAGVTFRYTENGPEGLLADKKVIVAVASGGVAIGSPADFLTPHLKVFFGFIGLQDVTFLNADDVENFDIAA